MSSAQTPKLVIAVEYLDTAAVLWLHEVNHYSAMHLAGAAEEIAGKACRISGKRAHYDDLRKNVLRMLSSAGIAHTEKQLTEAFYGPKNAIKHMDSKNDATVSIDARKEAAEYICAAYCNFEKLGLAAILVI